MKLNHGEYVCDSCHTRFIWTAEIHVHDVKHINNFFIIHLCKKCLLILKERNEIVESKRIIESVWFKHL